MKISFPFPLDSLVCSLVVWEISSQKKPFCSKCFTVLLLWAFLCANFLCILTLSWANSLIPSRTKLLMFVMLKSNSKYLWSWPKISLRLKKSVACTCLHMQCFTPAVMKMSRYWHRLFLGGDGRSLNSHVSSLAGMLDFSGLNFTRTLQIPTLKHSCFSLPTLSFIRVKSKSQDVY